MGQIHKILKRVEGTITRIVTFKVPDPVIPIDHEGAANKMQSGEGGETPAIGENDELEELKVLQGLAREKKGQIINNTREQEGEMLDAMGSYVVDEHSDKTLTEILAIDADLKTAENRVRDIEPEFAVGEGERGGRVKNMENEISEGRVVSERGAIEVENGKSTPKRPPSFAENTALHCILRLHI